MSCLQTGAAIYAASLPGNRPEVAIYAVLAKGKGI